MIKSFQPEGSRSNVRVVEALGGLDTHTNPPPETWAASKMKSSAASVTS